MIVGMIRLVKFSKRRTQELRQLQERLEEVKRKQSYYHKQNR